MPDPIVLFSTPSSPAAWTTNGPFRTRTATVIAKSESHAKEQLVTNTGIDEGVVYEDLTGNVPDPYLVCVGIQARAVTQTPIDGEGLFAVDVSFAYASNVVGRPRQVPNFNPEYWIEASVNTEESETDVDGNPIQNTAGEPFVPPRQTRHITRVLVAQWWRYGTDTLALADFYGSFEGKTNSQPFHAPVGNPNVECFYCLPFEIEKSPVRVPTVGQKLFRITARFEFKVGRTIGGTFYGGWRLVLPNRGRRVVTLAGIQQLHEGSDFDASKPLLTDPVWINAAGSARSITPVYTDFKVYNTIDFNLLNL